jgi:glycosyltransferase involved in cell wall biosynthesis
MRIAILLLNAGRGSGEVARQQARHLVAAGHDIVFMHPRLGEEVAGADNRDIALHTDVVPVHENLPSAGPNQMQVARMPHDQAVSYLPDYETALEEVAEGVDVFLGHHANLSAVATARVARRHDKPYALFLHGTGIEPRHEGLYADETWALIEDAVLGAAGILVTTDYVRDELVRPMVDVRLDDFLVLPCGIDTGDFTGGPDAAVMAKFDLPAVFVICPGALTEAKGPQNVVTASKEYADLAPTIFIGGGPLQDQLEADLGDRGKLLGFVSSEDKAALIRTATILAAAPEKKEHFGIIYAEALTAGTPPVAYGGGGVGSIITPETGVLTERDPAALGRAIRALLEDEARLDGMIEKGRARGAALYCYRELGKKLEGWLAGLAN